MPLTVRNRSRERRLIDRAALGGITIFTLLGWCGLAWLASLRQDHAASAPPSALSLRFLELGTAADPRDSELGLRLAQKRLQAGELSAALELVQQLLSGPAPRADAQLLWIEIHYARWCAVPADAAHRAERAERLTELNASLDQLVAQRPSQDLLLRIAALYREIEQPAKAAAVFDRLARRSERPELSDIRRADSAWIEAGQPLAAAELYAFLASRRGAGDAQYARLALERARLADAPEPLSDLIARMRKLYPHDTQLLKLALRLTEASDVRRASDLALELTRTLPELAFFHREAARLAEASGRSLCALDQYMWLWRNQHRAQDRENALRLARANWDLQLLRELLDGPGASEQPRVRARRGCSGRARRAPLPQRRTELPADASEWDERFQLYEALGDTAALRELLGQVVRVPAGDTPLWWRRKLALERRLDDSPAALRTLAEMLARHPEPHLREELADLQLSLGDAQAALATMQATPSEQCGLPCSRQIGELAAAAGDFGAERRAYEAIVRIEDATLQDHQRLLALAIDEQSAAAIASSAARRFESFEMFLLALELHMREGDEAAQLALFTQGQLLSGIIKHGEYWQQRIMLQQRRAERAAGAKNYDAAKLALTNAHDMLRSAAKRAPPKRQYDSLWDAQHAQALSLGLASGDNALALRAFLASRSSLNARERVYLLIKLGQTSEALEEARRELAQERMVAIDRTVLEDDALSLMRGRATDVLVQGIALSMPGLLSFGTQAQVHYAEIAGALRVSIGYTEHRPVLESSEPLLTDSLHDLTGSLFGRIGRVGVELGANVRDTVQVRPFGTLQVQLSGDEDRGTSLQVQGNVTNLDTARMRALGVADVAALKAVFGIGEYVWVSGRAAAEMYSTRAERRRLGFGATIDLSVGSTHKLPAGIGTAGARVFTRGAPRYREGEDVDPLDPTSVWLPASTIWSGLGLSLGRGQLAAPLLFGRQLSYALDASAGYIWPASGLGWSLTGQVGVSCFGADSLWFSATAGNVLGANGFAGHLGYVVSFAD